MFGILPRGPYSVPEPVVNPRGVALQQALAVAQVESGMKAYSAKQMLRVVHGTVTEHTLTEGVRP